MSSISGILLRKCLQEVTRNGDKNGGKNLENLEN
jgi:hypothetical protein